MTTFQQRLNALNTAIKRGDGIIAFSRALGVTHQAVTTWRRKGQVPIARAFTIDRLYGVPAALLMAPELAEAYSEPERGESVL